MDKNTGPPTPIGAAQPMKQHNISFKLSVHPSVNSGLKDVSGSKWSFGSPEKNKPF